MPDDRRDSQVPWLPDERFELVLDARTGVGYSPVAGEQVLTVTTHRAIQLGSETGKRTTSMVPLERITGVEVIDATRPSERLTQGLAVFAIGVVLGGLSYFLIPTAPLLPVLVGGLPVLVAIYILAGYAFPDSQGELLLHTGAYALHQPLLTAEARRDAYLAAHRIYELMASARGPRLGQTEAGGAAAGVSVQPPEPRAAPREEPVGWPSATRTPRTETELASFQRPAPSHVAPPAPRPQPAPPAPPDEPPPAPSPAPDSRWSAGWPPRKEPESARPAEQEPWRPSGYAPLHEDTMASEEEHRDDHAPAGERALEEAPNEEDAKPRQD